MISAWTSTIRLFRRSPSATISMVATLAVGIGAAVVAFSFVDGTLLSGLPYPDADRLVWVSSGTMDLPFGKIEYVNRNDLAAWRRAAHLISDWAVYWPGEATLSNRAKSARVGVAEVSAGFLSVFGASPVRGRGFLPEEMVGEGASVAVVTDSVWRQFGAGPGVVVRLDGVPYNIVGVLPPAFQYPDATKIGVLTPLPADDTMGNKRVIAKLRRGASFDVAKLELQSIHSGIPGLTQAKPITFQSLADRQTAGVRSAVIAVFIAANVVWIIACLNLGSIVLGTGVARRQEVAVRSALGATRLDLFSRFLCEYGILALAGCIGGVLLAYYLRTAILSLLPEPSARAVQSRFGPGVLAYAVAISGLSAVLLSTILLWIGTRSNCAELLRGTHGTAVKSSHKNILRFAVAAEFAATVVILVAVVSVSHGFLQQRYGGLGFKEEGMLTFRVTFPDVGYEKDYQKRAFLKSVSERSTRLPGVRAVSFCSSLPPTPLGLVAFEAEGATTDGGAPSMVSQQVINSNYFQLMRIPMLAGRSLNRDDDEKATKAAVVNRALARQYFGGEAVAVGKAISLPGLEHMNVVGVVDDVKNAGLASAPEPEVYLGAGQTTSPSVTFAVETNLRNSLSLTNSVEQVIRSVDPSVAAADTQTMGQRLTATIASLRFAAVLLVVFGSIALFLAIIGIYGISSYSTESRTREIAVRLALGSTPSQIVAPVLTEMLGMSALGTAVAVGLSLWSQRMLAGVLNHTVADGWMVLAGVSVVTFLVACFAACVPVYRTLSSDTIRCLKA